VGLGGQKADGSSYAPVLSPDGRHVWFSSAASNLVAGDTNGRVDLFVHDRQTGTSTRYDLTAATGQPLNGDAWLADVRPDGRWVLFSSTASTIVANDTNDQSDAFALDTGTGTVRRVSPALGQANGASYAGAISADGRYAFFESTASNLVPGDTNGVSDIFSTDLLSSGTQRVSLDATGAQWLTSSTDVTSSDDGRTIAYRLYQGGVYTIWKARLALP
jgi:Tol biopolymer transport system component